MRYDDCEMRNNGDGVKPVYQQREQRNKLALKNLSRGMKGKLGKLSNLQTFNFTITTIASGNLAIVITNYNTVTTFPANVSDCVMFGSSGINGKALYYNILGVKADMSPIASGSGEKLEGESFIEFYPLQNINGSTTSLGTKIPIPSSLHGTSSGTIALSTSGAIDGNQSFSCDFVGTPINAFRDKGLRASGLALKKIYMRFATATDIGNLQISVQVFVDLKSVSTSY